jgi:hypothetical protein
MVNKTVVALCIAACLISLMGLVGWVSYTGGDVERILGWSGTTLGPLIGVFGAVLMTKRVNDTVKSTQQDVKSTQEDVEETKGHVKVIRVQTNGKMTAFGERLDALERLEQERRKGA